MNLLVLVWSYLRARPFNTVLHMVMLALGVAVIMVILLASSQLQERMDSQTRGVDLVVGAKGSPMQLILCNIFQADFPTGNIRLTDAERIARHRLVKKAVPLALGDSYLGVRIIGTTQGYADWYDATVGEGQWYGAPMEVVAGTQAAQRLGLTLGSTFSSAHGLSSDGDAHEQSYKVVGILKPTGDVIDQLLLTAVESVWAVHGAHEEKDQPVDTTAMQSRLVPGTSLADTTREITALLVKYRNPMAALQLPRFINGETRMQAASPAFETSRLFAILGAGIEILQGFAALLVFIAALSIFMALYNSLKERQYDLAIMRAMGAGKTKLVFSVLLEGATLTTLGSLFGLLLAHGTLAALAAAFDPQHAMGFRPWTLVAQEAWALAGSVLLGLLCSLLPAWQAYRTNIHRVLAGG